MKILLTNFLFIISHVAFGQHCFEDCATRYYEYVNTKLFDTNGVMNINNINKSTELFERMQDSLIGCKTPEFNVKSIDGKKFTSKNLIGKVIVLNFFSIATNAPCRTEMLSLNKLVTKTSDTNVVFIAFSSDSTRAIFNFLKTNKFKYNIVSSDYDMDQKFFIIGCLPTNMVFDKRGILRFVFRGGYYDSRAKKVVRNKLKRVIDKCLKEN